MGKIKSRFKKGRTIWFNDELNVREICKPSELSNIYGLNYEKVLSVKNGKLLSYEGWRLDSSKNGEIVKTRRFVPKNTLTSDDKLHWIFWLGKKREHCTAKQLVKKYNIDGGKANLEDAFKFRHLGILNWRLDPKYHEDLYLLYVGDDYKKYF